MRKLWVLLTVLFLPALAGATVSGTASTVAFTCTNSTGPFPFTFPVLNTGALQVIDQAAGAVPGVMTVLASNQWTATPVNGSYANGGSVTLVTACATGDTLTIARTTETTQLTAFTPFMPALYANFENRLDQLSTGAQDTYRLSQVHVGSIAGAGTATVSTTPLGQYLNLIFPNANGCSATGPLNAIQVNSTPTCSGSAATADAPGNISAPGSLTSPRFDFAILAGQYASVPAAEAAGVLCGGNCVVKLDKNFTLSAPTTITSKWDMTGGGVITRGTNAITLTQPPITADVPWLDAAGTGVVTIQNMHAPIKAIWYGMAVNGSLQAQVVGTVNITACAVTTDATTSVNQATLTAANTFKGGEYVSFSGLVNCSFLNGTGTTPFRVSNLNLSNSQFQVVTSHATVVSAGETATATQEIFTPSLAATDDSNAINQAWASAVASGNFSTNNPGGGLPVVLPDGVIYLHNPISTGVDVTGTSTPGSYGLVGDCAAGPSATQLVTDYVNGPLITDANVSGGKVGCFSIAYPSNAAATGVAGGEVYSSGGSVTGTQGQTCITSAANGGGTGASGSFTLTGSNTISGTMGLSFAGGGYASVPTSWALSNGTATCSGTVTTTGGSLVGAAIAVYLPSFKQGEIYNIRTFNAQQTLAFGGVAQGNNSQGEYSNTIHDIEAFNPTGNPIVFNFQGAVNGGIGATQDFIYNIRINGGGAKGGYAGSPLQNAFLWGGWSELHATALNVEWLNFTKTSGISTSGSVQAFASDVRAAKEGTLHYEGNTFTNLIDSGPCAACNMHNIRGGGQFSTQLDIDVLTVQASVFNSANITPGGGQFSVFGFQTVPNQGFGSSVHVHTLNWFLNFVTGMTAVPAMNFVENANGVGGTIAYASGGTAVGSGTCVAAGVGGGGANAAGTFTAAVGVISGNLTVTQPGASYTSIPTSWTLTNGTATCSGTVVTTGGTLATVANTSWGSIDSYQGDLLGLTKDANGNPAFTGNFVISNFSDYYRQNGPTLNPVNTWGGFQNVGDAGTTFDCLVTRKSRLRFNTAFTAQRTLTLDLPTGTNNCTVKVSLESVTGSTFPLLVVDSLGNNVLPTNALGLIGGESAEFFFDAGSSVWRMGGFGHTAAQNLAYSQGTHIATIDMTGLTGNTSYKFGTAGGFLAEAPIGGTTSGRIPAWGDGTGGLTTGFSVLGTGSVTATQENVVTFSATPTFLNTAALNTITLTGNVTSSTLGSTSAGFRTTLLICQDGSGAHTFVYPANVHGGTTIGSTASLCTSQSFTWSTNLSGWYASGPASTNE